MIEVINDTDREIVELDLLNKYVEYLVGKLDLGKCEFNIIIVDNKRIHEINKE